MKTVSGKVISTRPVSLAKASKVLSKFVSVDNGASPAISIYLGKASEAFDELVHFHKVLRNPKSDLKSRKATSLSESVNIPPREVENEDAGSDRRKHREKNACDDGLVEANEDLGTVEMESANGDRFVGMEGEKRKRKIKDKKLKGQGGNAVESMVENGEVMGKDGNSNEVEDADQKKKKKKTKKGEVSIEIGENGTVEEDKDRGKKRKIEVTRERGEEDGSVEQRSKKKKKKRRQSREED